MYDRCRRAALRMAVDVQAECGMASIRTSVRWLRLTAWRRVMSDYGPMQIARDALTDLR